MVASSKLERNRRVLSTKRPPSSLNKKSNPYEFFSVASDILVLKRKSKKASSQNSCSHELEVLLIQRRYPPHQGEWALPGGFVDREEDALTAARRELREETGLRAKKLVEFGTFSNPQRDPRGRTLSVCFYMIYTSACGTPHGADDASHVQWFSIRKLPRLAFDHKEMIEKGLQAYRRNLRC